jgi:hypothetical protein
MRRRAILALVAFAGGTGAAIESQPAGSYTAGPTRLSRIGITVAQLSTGGGDGWTNGWEGLSESPRGWLPDPLSASAFSVQWRSWSSPPGYVNFGLTNIGGRNGVMYRQMDNEMPVFNADRRVNVGFPAGTMAVHLEWWAYIDSSGRMPNGKRFGFHDAGGAGGGTVGGANDTTTSGLGRAGGWSVRWTPRGSASAELRVPDRHALYTYCQNRRDLGAPYNGGKLWGATFNTASGTLPLGQWVRLNWTLVLNSPFVADGLMRLWVNGTQVSDRPGILWQQDITQHPFHRFWWSWMWGGVPENMPPSSTWREHYGDFRIGVTSRANALANPWPF